MLLKIFQFRQGFTPYQSESDTRQLITASFGLVSEYFAFKNTTHDSIRVNHLARMFLYVSGLTELFRMPLVTEPFRTIPNLWFETTKLETTISRQTQHLTDWLAGNEFQTILFLKELKLTLQHITALAATFELTPEVLASIAQISFNKDMTPLKPLALPYPLFKKAGRPSKKQARTLIRFDEYTKRLLDYRKRRVRERKFLKPTYNAAWLKIFHDHKENNGEY